MGLFRRTRPLHEQLAERARLAEEDGGRRPLDPGSRLLEAGIHGLPRHREWDEVVHVAASSFPGERLQFVVLADGIPVIEADEPPGAYAEGHASWRDFADAFGLAPPYRVEALRRRDGWAAAATRIRTTSLDAGGDEIELAVSRDGRTLRVDGSPEFGSIPVLERLGETHGPSYVVRASRLLRDVWEVEAAAL